MPARIGFVLKGYPRLSETFIAQEIYLLEQRGFELEIYSMRAPREEARHPVHEAIKARVVYIPEDRLWRPRVAVKILGAAASFPLGFARALAHAGKAALSSRSHKPLKRLAQAAWLVAERKLGGESSVRHLHSHFVHVPTEMTFYVAKITGLTYSISAHAKDIYTSTPAEVRERVRGSQFLMTCTHFNFGAIREIVGPAHERKVHEVYHGVRLDAFRPDPAAASRPLAKRLLTVARLVEKKGYDDALRALARLKGEGLVLQYDIFGEGGERKSLEALTRELGLVDQVRFHGSVTQPTVLAAYREGGVFLLASRETADGDRDGIPNSMAEAMSMELPVVATRVSGIPELVTDDETGLLVGQREPEALAAAIRRLYAEPELAARLGRAARARVSEVFDADRCIDRCEHLLAPFAKGRG